MRGRIAKRALLAMLVVLMGGCLCLTACNAGGTTHGHTYDREIADGKYLKAAATCVSKAIYYKSCVCGEKGTETFEYGETIAHPAETTWDYNETHHWHNSTCACNVKVDFAEHTIDDSGWCTVCEQTIFSTDGVYYEISVDGTYAGVFAYAGTATKVKIADTYEGLPVTNIYDNAFENATIVSVIIPDSVTSIGAKAFYNCSSLTSVTIGNSVTSIGGSAFSGCTNLQYNTFGKLNYLGNAYNPYMVLVTPVNKNFREYEISDTAKIIFDGAFGGCTRLTNITIPDSLTTIGNDAFDGCNTIQGNQYDNAKYLGNENNPYLVLYKAVDYSNITTCDIHEDTKIILSGVFDSCEKLATITIPDGVTAIQSSAFRYCTELTSIVIPDRATLSNLHPQNNYFTL